MASTAPARELAGSRLIGLDLLRFTAVVMVIGRHMEPTPETLPWTLKWPLDIWHACGGLGVDLFFVLSGFLVSGLLFSEYQKHRRLSISRFYVRRAWKIYPAFYLLIGVTYLYCLLVLGYKLHDRPIFAELLFIQSYRAGHWNHTWTLAIEEHFYLLLPLVLLALAKRKPGVDDPFRPILYLVAAVSVLCCVARIANLCVRPEIEFMTHAFPTHLRIDSLFFGAAIAYCYHFHSATFQRIFGNRTSSLIASGIGLVALATLIASFSESYHYTLGFTQYYVGFAAILVGVLTCRIPVNRVTCLLATLGTFSYSIYLWHMATMYYVIPQLREAGYSWSARFALYFLGAFVVGIAMAKLVEVPTLRLRDRWFPSRSDLPTANTPSLPRTAPTSRQAA